MQLAQNSFQNQKEECQQQEEEKKSDQNQQQQTDSTEDIGLKVKSNITLGKIALTTNTIIGKGMTSKVYKQKDNIKCVKVVEKQFGKLYKKEQKILKIIEELDVTPKIYQFDNQQFAIEMEKGVEDLKTVNQNLVKKKLWWREDQITKILKQVSQYILKMSNINIFHTDITPQNIILMDEKTTKIKLVDFANAVTDVIQHPKLVKGSQDTKTFNDKQQQYLFFKTQCEMIEVVALLKMIKTFIHTTIFQFNVEDKIKTMKVDSIDYWKVVSLHSSGISKFFQYWTEEQLANFNEEKFKKVLEDIDNLK